VRQAQLSQTAAAAGDFDIVYCQCLVLPWHKTRSHTWPHIPTVTTGLNNNRHRQEIWL
jgi:hypothetical protein